MPTLGKSEGNKMETSNVASDIGESIIDRTVSRYPVDPGLAGLIIEAAIEEIHRLCCVVECSHDVALHFYRNVSPESCAHLLAIMQSAACDADSDNLYFEECSQRLSKGRDMMLLKEAAWLDERPDSMVELHKIQQIARKHQREENQKSGSK